MRVKIRLFAHLQRYAPGDSDTFYLELNPGITVGGIVKSLGIPSGVKRVILVNGRPVDVTTPVGDGDLVTLLVPTTGG